MSEQDNIQNLNQQQILNIILTALQSCAYGYPVYNYLTQHQNNLRKQLVDDQLNPLVKKGQKYFSQNDEDGILLEILSRIGLMDNKESHTFIEFGIGNGLENNSIILLMLGWVGLWAGNEELAFQNVNNKKLVYAKGWISLDNLLQIYTAGIGHFNVNDYDLLSMDLDGNDYYFLKSILDGGHKPKIIITEYNAKFPPPIEFTINYDPAHAFKDDYMGASLQTLYNLIVPQGYFLVACNVTGSNAFFVRNDFKSRFTDIPQSIYELFMPANYGIVTRIGHPVSAKTVSSFLI